MPEADSTARFSSTQLPPKVKDLTGMVFGRLTVVSFAGTHPYGTARHKVAHWNCRCECGTEKTVRSNAMMKGTTTSCGCWHSEVVSELMRTHGKRSSPLYCIWHGIKVRCCEPTNRAYKWYGGRGIRMCDRWLNSVDNFIADMSPRPSKKHSIDRIDNDGPYSPENCRWATQKEQSRNTARTFFIEFNGKTQCLQDWAAELGVCAKNLRTRIAVRKWDIQRAMTTPVIPRPRKKGTA